MKLCVVGYPNWPHVRNWLRQLAQHPGIQTALLSREPPGVPGIEHLRYEFPLAGGMVPWQVFNIRVMRRALREFRPDVVHVHNIESTWFPLTLSRNYRLVATTYGLDVSPAPGLPETRRQRFLKRWLLRSADAVTALSHEHARDTERYGGLKAGSVLHTPFGVDMAAFGEAARGRQPSDVLRIGCLKRWVPEYAPLDFVRAVHLVARTGLPVRATMVGHGPLEWKIRELVDSLGLKYVLEIRHTVPPEQVEALYRDLDLVVVPSLQESFGVAAVEGMAAGLPVIATRVGGLPEVLGTVGVMVPPGSPGDIASHIIALAGDPARRERLGQLGRERAAARFDRELTFEIMRKVWLGWP